MEKLIVTNCATDCSMYPEWQPRFHDSKVLANSIAAAWRAGAPIAHIHAPPEDYKAWESPTPDEFMHRIKHLPQGSYYMTSVTGATHMQLTAMSVLMGGHVRVGTEDEPYLAPGKLGDNVDHVVRIVSVSRQLGREVATTDEARATLKIPT